ncbi:P-loop containing nucleoside triphosphate hydrolase protein [Tribonema minus]|uniref:P-loop containing nucleoside triphosphate hydrolase protein n=1 Tax=Tribonema minus TaxID=303371 RepID=A0A836CEF5_9STRA|nr:P-loop containing nucleoside triphosphate hydrolase protein [Tribonema minus]
MGAASPGYSVVVKNSIQDGGTFHFFFYKHQPCCCCGLVKPATIVSGMNSGSSRSRSMFIITMQQRNTQTSSIKTGMLYLVDLGRPIVGGGRRGGARGVGTIATLGCSAGDQATAYVMRQATVCSGTSCCAVLEASASDAEAAAHVPYRNSKLTRALQNSLGGNRKTCLIINCSLSPYNADKTTLMLRLGSCAKRINHSVNTAVVNETRSAGELSALLATNTAVVNEMRSVGELSALLATCGRRAAGRRGRRSQQQPGYIAALEAQLAQGAGGSSIQRPFEEEEAPLEGAAGGSGGPAAAAAA